MNISSCFTIQLSCRITNIFGLRYELLHHLFNCAKLSWSVKFWLIQTKFYVQKFQSLQRTLRNKWHWTSSIKFILINEISLDLFAFLICSLVLMFTFVGSGSKTVPSTEGSTSAGSSIKLSISHLFFLICAATVASTFTTYWSSHLSDCLLQHHIPTYSWLMMTIIIFFIYY